MTPCHWKLKHSSDAIPTACQLWCNQRGSCGTRNAGRSHDETCNFAWNGSLYFAQLKSGSSVSAVGLTVFYVKIWTWTTCHGCRSLFLLSQHACKGRLFADVSHSFIFAWFVAFRGVSMSLLWCITSLYICFDAFISDHLSGTIIQSGCNWTPSFPSWPSSRDPQPFSASAVEEKREQLGLPPPTHYLPKKKKMPALHSTPLYALLCVYTVGRQGY